MSTNNEIASAMRQALEGYMAAYGQALEAHGIELQQQQIEADRFAREALMSVPDGAQPAVALEQRSNEHLEPVAIRLWDSQWVNVVNHDNCYQGWDKEDAINHAVKMTEKYIAANVSNNTTPPQHSAIARKPLTDEEIMNIAKVSCIGISPHEDTLNFAKVIEAVHGIKEGL